MTILTVKSLRDVGEGHLECLPKIIELLTRKVRPRGYKTVFILNSAEHDIILLINIKMPTIVDILTFICMINTTSESIKAINFFI